MGNKVTLRHKVTGKVDTYPEHYLNHFGLKDVLEPVEEGTPVDGCTDCGLPERREDCEQKPEECLETEGGAIEDAENGAPTAPDSPDEDEGDIDIEESEETRQGLGEKVRNWYNS